MRTHSLALTIVAFPQSAATRDSQTVVIPTRPSPCNVWVSASKHGSQALLPPAVQPDFLGVRHCFSMGGVFRELRDGR